MAPSKALFLRAKGVYAVHVLGSAVEVVYDEGVTTPERLIEESGVRNYYRVSILSDEEAADARGRRGLALALSPSGRVS